MSARLGSPQRAPQSTTRRGWASPCLVGGRRRTTWTAPWTTCWGPAPGWGSSATSRWRGGESTAAMEIRQWWPTAVRPARQLWISVFLVFINPSIENVGGKERLRPTSAKILGSLWVRMASRTPGGDDVPSNVPRRANPSLPHLLRLHQTMGAAMEVWRFWFWFS